MRQDFGAVADFVGGGAVSRIDHRGRPPIDSNDPRTAFREALANALIHQDLTTIGAGPLIEVYANRIELNTPGEPLVEPDRLLDAPPRSRNE